MQWIELLYLIRGELASTAILAGIFEKPIPEVLCGHDSQGGGFAPVEASFVVAKIKKAVFLDGAAERCSKHIANQLVPRQPGQIVEEVVCASGGVAIELVGGAMEGVGPALGYQRNLRTRAASQIRARVGGHCPKLLDRIQRHA